MLVLFKMVKQVMKEVCCFVCEYVNDVYKKDGICLLMDDFIGGGCNYDYLILLDEVKEFGLKVCINMFEVGYGICQLLFKDEFFLIVFMFNMEDGEKIDLVKVFKLLLDCNGFCFDCDGFCQVVI